MGQFCFNHLLLVLLFLPQVLLGSQESVDAPECKVEIKCKNGGTLQLEGTGTSSQSRCSCPPDWEGADCSEKKLHSCKNDADCQNGGECRQRPGDAAKQCQCNGGFSGSRCQRAMLCDPNPCQHNETCNLINNGNDFMCSCSTAWTGKTCNISRDVCKHFPCSNGATCEEDHCSTNGFRCKCSEHFKGLRCETLRNPCSKEQNICKNEGQCAIARTGGPLCFCSKNFTGDLCDQPSSKECNPNPCQNNGSCSEDNSMANGFKCICTDGFFGEKCEHRSQLCSDASCLNGICKVDHQSKAYCECLQGFTGARCDVPQGTVRPEEATEVSKCGQLLCYNDGWCAKSVNDNSYRCKCRPGFTGEQCEKQSPVCSRFCLTAAASNNRCDPACNTRECGFDAGDCREQNSLWSKCNEQKCMSLSANGKCDAACNTELCLFDAGDCNQQSKQQLLLMDQCPQSDFCKMAFANEVCNSECNSAACQFDGGDCPVAVSRKNLMLDLSSDTRDYNSTQRRNFRLELTLLFGAVLHIQWPTIGDESMKKLRLQLGQCVRQYDCFTRPELAVRSLKAQLLAGKYSPTLPIARVGLEPQQPFRRGDDASPFLLYVIIALCVLLPLMSLIGVAMSGLKRKRHSAPIWFPAASSAAASSAAASSAAVTGEMLRV